MIINKYKTSKRYGTYIRTVIPEKLSNLLAKYIEEQEIKNGEPLFGTEQKNIIHTADLVEWLEICF